MDSKVKVGVIGVGKMGLLHLAKLVEMPDVEVVGICDTDTARASEAAAKHGVKRIEQSELLFEADAVFIATPTATHFKLARLTLESGAHVLIEKPLGQNPDEAAELVRMARDQKLVLQVGLLERFRFLALSEGFPLSPCRFIESHRLSPSLGREGEKIDVIMDLMIHDLDLVLALVKEDPLNVSAVGVQVLTTSCDLANVRLEFPGGAVANLTASRVSARSMRKFRVFSSDTYASMDFVSNSVDLYSRRNGQVVEHKAIERVGLDALREQAVNFIESVRGRATPEVSGQDGLRALRVAGIIREKIRERAPGPPPPLPPELSA